MVIMACDDMVTMWSDCVFAMEKDVVERGGAEKVGTETDREQLGQEPL
jgi:hypothetical protein